MSPGDVPLAVLSRRVASENWRRTGTDVMVGTPGDAMVGTVGDAMNRHGIVQQGSAT
jgi:hypothetical protein